MISFGQVTVALTRRNVSTLFNDDKAAPNVNKVENGDVVDDDEEAPKKKVLPWQRNLKKGKKAAANKKTYKKTKPQSKKETEELKKDDPVRERVKKNDSKRMNDDVSDSESEEEEDDDIERTEEDVDKSNNESSEPEKDDDQLEKLQSDVALRRQKILEGKSQISHSVHCPFYPQDKQEYWWAYISDRRQQVLLTAPYHITNLVDFEEIQLKFTAPFKPGFYTFAVCLRSDSYFGFDLMKDIKVFFLFIASLSLLAYFISFIYSIQLDSIPPKNHILSIFCFIYLFNSI